ncbi:hypothetical protein TWF718_001222 [Orbilia javanica]|uniref:DUF7908 domain-containing protein n=1 Tax=Orbilia javanica TaxID=47235 RepID=A0AAN8N8G2_9PEZI
MAHPLFILAIFVGICMFSLSPAYAEPSPTPYLLPHHGHHAGSDCHGRRPLGYITPSHGAVPVPITAQGQPVTTCIPTAVARYEGGAVSVTKYFTSTYIWYSTYIAGYPHGKPQFISRGDQALTLPPKEPPKYEVRTATITTTGTVKVGKNTYYVERVPTKIEYVKEVSRSFGVCKAEDYFRWSQQNNERASRLGSKTLIDKGRINLGYLGLGSHLGDGVKGLNGKHTPRRLKVDYVSCHDDVCTTEAQNWSVGYRAQTKKRVIAAEFSGWCNGEKPYACELCADVRGYGRVTVTAKVHTPGPCTISSRITTEETITKTITRTRSVKITKTKTKDASGQATSRGGSSVEDSSSALPADPKPTSSGATSSSTSPSQPQVTSTGPSSSSDPEASSAPTGSQQAGSPFRIRIRSTSPTKRLLRRQSDAWYVGIIDNTLVVVEVAAEIVTFSISDKKLRMGNSDYAFADPDDLVARGPILIADTSSGPSTAFSIEEGTNRLLWVNDEFEKGTAEYCVDDDYDINGVYAGAIDALCDKVELIAEFTNDHAPLKASGSSTSAPKSEITSSSEITTSSSPSSSKDVPSSSLEPTALATGPPPISGTESAKSTSAGKEPSAADAAGRPVPSSSSVTIPSASHSSMPTSSTHTTDPASVPPSSSAHPSSSTPAPAKCTSVSSKNHIQNPGFESGVFTPWSPSSEGKNPEFSISTTYPYKGGRSVLIELTSAGSSVTLTQSITTCQGRKYTGAVWLDLGVTGDRRSCSLFITINGAATAEQAGTAGSYSEVPFLFTATSDTTTIGFMASCSNGVTKGTFYLDNIEGVAPMATKTLRAMATRRRAKGKTERKVKREEKKKGSPNTLFYSKSGTLFKWLAI